MHIAGHETLKIVESVDDVLAKVHRLPTLLAVEAGIQEVNEQLYELALWLLDRREMAAINHEIDDAEVEMVLSDSESQHQDKLNKKLCELIAIRDSIEDAIRIAHEDKIREDEEREEKYFTTVTIT